MPARADAIQAGADPPDPLPDNAPWRTRQRWDSIPVP
jgi:hypothetical protein